MQDLHDPQRNDLNASLPRVVMSKKDLVIPPGGQLELMPQEAMAFDHAIDIVRKSYGLFGFVPIHTGSLERIQVLCSKDGGDIDKEIFGLHRLATRANEQEDDLSLALRFDLTVPFARFVAHNQGQIAFPFKRFQVGDVWRGETPQDGRFRQFTQCDIDIVSPENLPLICDVEVPEAVDAALHALNIGPYEIRMSNRKLLEGFLTSVGVKDIPPVVRVLDKIEKIGPENIRKLLVESLSLPEDLAKKCIELAQIRTLDDSFVEKIYELTPGNDLMTQGIDELKFVSNALRKFAHGSVVVDLSIARGFNYYTGSVYEVKWHKHPELGSIASGGRYDNLLLEFSNNKMPGVGMSIGLTRIFSGLLKDEQFKSSRLGNTQILIACRDDSEIALARMIAQKLRAMGTSVEVYPKACDYKKQLKYADRKGIGRVLFLTHKEMKNMTTGQQDKIENLDDLESWLPLL